MELDPEIMAQLIAVFRVELEEQLAIITDGLIALEKGSAAEPASQLDPMFRAAHNIKGAARGVGVVDLAELAHALESLFARFKRAGVAPSAALIDLCLASLDRMRELMAAFADGRPSEFDLPHLIRELEQAAEQPAAPAETAIAAPPVAAPPQPPPRPEPAAEPPSPVAAEAVVRIAVDKLERLGGRADAFQMARIQLDEQVAELRRLDSLIQGLSGLWAATGRRQAAALPPELVRLLESGGDLVREARDSAIRLHRQLRRTNNQLQLLTSGFQEEVRMLRLVPAASVLRPLARSARDIARELGKQVELTIEGEQIELDRQVLEGLRDPLMHLLRNAIDHGLEATEQRRAVGKPERGEVRISVEAQGGEVVLTLADDGAGIDPERVGQSAVRRGVISEAERAAMEPAALRDLIFRPGFSTRDEVSAISGRGVGLDVVAANLQGIKGVVAVESSVGHGTCFRLTVPLTLATDRGLLVTAAGSAYAIPVTGVERVLELPPSAVVNVAATQAVMVEGRPVALRQLSQVLGERAAEPPTEGLMALVVLSRGHHRVALRVDELVGEREIVIKPLTPPLISVRHLIGATLTGAGEVIMVLDPGQVVATALELAVAPLPTAAATIDHTPRVLVVDDSITTRTLERTILENKGFAVTIAVNGKEAWDLLQNEPLFDLIITDIEMPVMDGLELTTHIKGSPTLRRTPVIIVSSLGSDEQRRRGMEAGADAYIVKSEFETRALLEVVRQLI